MTYFLDNLESYEAEIGGHYAKNGSPTQDGNHGVTLHIFETIGIVHKYVLDIGAYSTKSSNVFPIMSKYGIPGLLLDGENKHNDPNVVKVWIEKNNICETLQKYLCPKDMDYISIDIDNMDYWILKSLLESGYTSNLLIAEFNPIWRFDESYTKAYVEDARKQDYDTSCSSNYGASLKAITNLLQSYGYRLIHVTKKNERNEPSNINAIFIQSKFDVENKFANQEDVIKTLFPKSFIETHKHLGNKNKFGTTDVDEIKIILKQNNHFIEV